MSERLQDNLFRFGGIGLKSDRREALSSATHDLSRVCRPFMVSFNPGTCESVRRSMQLMVSDVMPGFSRKPMSAPATTVAGMARNG
jgi:hypothetical protein